MLSSLNNLKLGEKAVIKAIYGENEMKRRLLDIGLGTGLVVECVLANPMGDPKAYWIKGALIAIRRKDASNILVER